MLVIKSKKILVELFTTSTVLCMRRLTTVRTEIAYLLSNYKESSHMPEFSIVTFKNRFQCSASANIILILNIAQGKGRYLFSYVRIDREICSSYLEQQKLIVLVHNIKSRREWRNCLQFHHFDMRCRITLPSSDGLSQDFAESGQNRVTEKNRVRAGSSHSAVCNITVAKFNNKNLFCNLHWADTESLKTLTSHSVTTHHRHFWLTSHSISTQTYCRYIHTCISHL